MCLLFDFWNALPKLDTNQGDELHCYLFSFVFVLPPAPECSLKVCKPCYHVHRLTAQHEMLRTDPVPWLVLGAQMIPNPNPTPHSFSQMAWAYSVISVQWVTGWVRLLSAPHFPLYAHQTAQYSTVRPTSPGHKKQRALCYIMYFHYLYNHFQPQKMEHSAEASICQNLPYRDGWCSTDFLSTWSFPAVPSALCAVSRARKSDWACERIF